MKAPINLPSRWLNCRAFTLIEMMVVLIIISMVLYIVLPVTSNLIIQAKVSSERTTLQQMAVNIQSSFNSSDFENTNLAAIATDIPPGIDATAFTTNSSLTAIPSSTNITAGQPIDWFAKVGRIMGYTPTTAAPSPTSQPAMAAILLNAYGNIRMLYAAPAEATQQRFMLVSLVSPSGELVLPPYQATAAWFNDIWNNQWTNTSSLPANWLTELTPAQIAAWTNGYGGTNCWKLVVIPITLRRFSITVTNTHPTDNAWIYYNGNNYTLHTTNGDTQVGFAPAASGVLSVPFTTPGPASTPGILGGRQVIVTRGATELGAATVMQFFLTDNGQVLVQ